MVKNSLINHENALTPKTNKEICADDHNERIGSDGGLLKGKVFRNRSNCMQIYFHKMNF